MSTALTTGILSQRFQPTQLDELRVWLDAKDVKTISKYSGTDAVQQWDDKSPYENHFKSTSSSAAPNSGTQTINSINSLDFRGSTIAYLTSSNAIGISGDMDRHIFIVMQFDTSWGTQQYALFNHGKIELSENIWGIFNIPLFFGSGAAWVLELDPNDANYNYSNTGIVQGEPIIFELSHDGSSTTSGMKMYVNGTQLSVTNSNETVNTANTTMILGFYDSGFGSGPVLRGRIGEVIYYKGIRTASERRMIYSYIKEKWKVS